jgi:tetratricopeptide (TPR) repeat protein
MALQYYQQSLAADSTFTNPYYMLGEIYHGLNDTEMAKTYLERYLELDPEGFRAQGAQGLLTQIDEEQ